MPRLPLRSSTLVASPTAIINNTNAIVFATQCEEKLSGDLFGASDAIQTICTNFQAITQDYFWNLKDLKQTLDNQIRSVYFTTSRANANIRSLENVLSNLGNKIRNETDLEKKQLLIDKRLIALKRFDEANAISREASLNLDSMERLIALVNMSMEQNSRCYYKMNSIVDSISTSKTAFSSLIGICSATQLTSKRIIEFAFLIGASDSAKGRAVDRLFSTYINMFGIDAIANMESSQFTSPLFDNGVKLTDINQGGLGNCWLLATVNSVVANNPKLISKIIKVEKDGSYSVTLYGTNGKKIVVNVTELDIAWFDTEVNKQHSDTTVEMWPSVIEAAIAKANQRIGLDLKDNTIRNLNGGTWAMEESVIKALTGKSTEKITVDETQIVDFVKKHMTRPMVTGTRELSKEDLENAPDWYAPTHAYTVIGVAGNKIVLSNPWGPDALGDGFKFEVSLDQYNKYFTNEILVGEKI